MSTLSSSSTLTEINAAFADNCSYAEDGSATKARAFVTACTLLLNNVYERMAHGGSGGQELERKTAHYLDLIKRADAWLASSPAASSSTGGGVKYTDFSSFRDY
jgi:hypothetical protein